MSARMRTDTQPSVGVLQAPPAECAAPARCSSFGPTAFRLEVVWRSLVEDVLAPRSGRSSVALVEPTHGTEGVSLVGRSSDEFRSFVSLYRVRVQVRCGRNRPPRKEP